MKKRDFKTLALLGLTSGLLLSQQAAEAGPAEYLNGQDLLAMMEDHACKAKGGCGSVSYQACSSKSSCDNMADHACKGKGGCGSVWYDHACKGKNGCGSNLTADRDQPGTANSPYQSPSASDSNKKKPDPNDGNLGYHLLSEDELMLELNEEGIKMYKSLSPEGKALALRVASARCGKTNECAGLNACQTDKNDCAGKGSCRGQGKCGMSDKNLAVKVVYNKMMKEKRSRAMNEQPE